MMHCIVYDTLTRIWNTHHSAKKKTTR